MLRDRGGSRTALSQSARAHRGDCLECRLCVASCPTAALAFEEDCTIDTAA